MLHSYRVRWGLAATDPRYAAIEQRLADEPRISPPTLMLHGTADPCNDPTTSEGKEGFFAGPYRRVLLDGVGHFPQREAADRVAAEILAFLG